MEVLWGTPTGWDWGQGWCLASFLPLEKSPWHSFMEGMLEGGREEPVKGRGVSLSQRNSSWLDLFQVSLEVGNQKSSYTKSERDWLSSLHKWRKEAAPPLRVGDLQPGGSHPCTQSSPRYFPTRGNVLGVPLDVFVIQHNNALILGPILT